MSTNQMIWEGEMLSGRRQGRPAWEDEDCTSSTERYEENFPYQCICHTMQL